MIPHPVGATAKFLTGTSRQFPYLIIVNALIPALLAGNSVILKPSPQTPLVGLRIAEIFSEAGLPANVLQNIQSGDPQLLHDLVQFPEIEAVSFTGSTAGGLALREAAAGRTIPLNLELGGNDPAYVRADADLEYVAAQLVDGAVFNAGQSCCAVERIYVHADIHDAFIRHLQEELKRFVEFHPFVFSATKIWRRTATSLATLLRKIPTSDLSSLALLRQPSTYISATPSPKAPSTPRPRMHHFQARPPMETMSPRVY